MINTPNYQIRTQIYESANSLVYRGVRKKDNQPVILKVLKEDYPTPEELTRYRQEYEITHDLDLTGVVKAYNIETYQNTLVIILEDFGGKSLKIWQEQRTFTLEELLRFAIQATEILGQIHGQNIIHKDINPSNIILNPLTRVLKIIDFGISTQFKKQHLTLKNPEVLEGTLAYMSPEQTGRMNRALDYRTDFYSLGATFYELLAGKVPFESTDAMELVHCHIAKIPVPVCEVNPDIPPILSDIVMKLMTKNAEDRYQSAWGLKVDLEKCLENLQGFKNLEGLNTGNLRGFQNLEGLEKENLQGFKNLEGFSFELAQHDISEHFQIPEKLYGRESEINTLLTGFERVASGKGEIMLVAGYSGIGKSALVKEIYKSLNEKQNYFISGKFDQFQRNIPYSAVVNAFKELVQQLLTETEEQLSAWKEKLLSTLGPNGQVIIDVIPEIEWIIGSQPAVPELGPTESQNRFNLVFQNFMRVFCQPEHPLIMFLDDLQWVDSATLKLLEMILTVQENTNLYLIGAYRDNEVTSTHPFMMTLDKLRSENVTVNQITLKPLAFEHLNQLIAESLHHNLKAVNPLTDLVIRKTGGNPFFVNQFLYTLYEEELLTFQTSEVLKTSEVLPVGWQWDITKIEALNITDNVVDLMIGKLKKLPKEAQQVLRLAACIGNTFDLDTLSVIYEKSITDTFRDLMPVLTEEFILPTSSVEMNGENIHSSKSLIRHFRFLHDRVQQAAYALIDEDQKKAVHLQIGRLLLGNTAKSALADHIFDIVEQLNQGIELVHNQTERNEIAQLNLIAGQKAKTAIAYIVAREYLSIGIELLPENSWAFHYPLTLTLHKEMGEIEYLNGHFEQSKTLLYLTIDKANTANDKAKVYNLLIVQYTMLAKYQTAIETGKKALLLLDINLPNSNYQEALQQEIAEINHQLENRAISSLINEPLTTRPETITALRILINMLPLTYLTAEMELLSFICGKMVNLSIKYGHIPESAHGYIDYGILLGPILGDYQKGYEFGELGMKLINQFNHTLLKGQIYHVFSSFLNHWFNPIKQAKSISDEAYQYALESGDLPHAGYTRLHRTVNLFCQGQPIEQLLADIPPFLQFAYQTKNQWVIDGLLAFQLNLILLVEFIPRQNYPEDMQYIENCQNHKSFNGICFYYITRGMIFYLFGELTKAHQLLSTSEQFISAIIGMSIVTEHNFYRSLTLAALYPNSSKEVQEQYWEQMVANQKQMKIWADNCPENFQSKYFLVQAEISRLQGETLEVILNFYDSAIASARDNGFIQIEALGNELAARFWLAKGKEKFAQTYLKEAHYCYQQWGAIAKINDLEKKYPQFLAPKKVHTMPTDVTLSTTSTSTQKGSEWLDLNSITKAAQTLSGEIVLSRLLKKMMHIVIENAGAQTGFLLLPQNDNWFIEAEGQVYNEEVKVLQSIPIETQPIAQTILQYVIRTQENMVLNNACQEGRFTRDAYIIKQRPKSVLCAPLVNQGKLIGILYLENNLTEGAFTPARLEVLKVLSSQLAISIENALLYRTLEQKVEERTAQLAEANTQLAKTNTQLADANEEISTLNEQLKEENIRMSAELDVSRQLQQMLLPKEKELEAIDSLDIAGFMEPADEVGGDYYDVLQHKGRILFGIGDVTGHGLESGALAIMIQAAIRTLLANNETDPVKFFSALNEMVFHNVQRMNAEKSLTLALVDYQENQLYLSGQHEEMIVVRNGELELIDTMDLGFPVGLDSDIAEFVNQIKVPLKAGDVVVLYTDGITEAENTDGQMYGLEPLCKIIQQNWQKTAHEIQQTVINDVRQFIGKQKVFDDITLLVLKQK